MLQVHTVAAGGGSVCFFDGARLRVGPHSAGADPGPACYRRGGPLTITDCNVLLGRVRPEFFPAIFGPEADQPLDREHRREEIRRRSAPRSSAPAGRAISPEEAAEGFLTIANLSMAEAIKKISIQRGYNPAEYALVAFGGAGGQHACAVADAVGVETILLHPLAGVLSAWGMGWPMCAPWSKRRWRKGSPTSTTSARRAEALARKARAALDDAGRRPSRCHGHRAPEIRRRGLGAAPAVRGWRRRCAAAFEAEHQKRFGFTDPARAISWRRSPRKPLRLATDPTLPGAGQAHVGGGDSAAVDRARLRAGGRAHDAPVFERASLPPGFERRGPALILEQGATTYVDAGLARACERAWRYRSHARAPRAERAAIGTHADPILLEVFNNRFMGVAEEMGLALQTTASSVNIKERLDFSCAVFDETGGLVANAPHIPVHLGSMSDSVREIIRQRGDTMRAGDIYMLNAPHAGGTHLPDITVIAPVILDGESTPAFFTAARGHHADIGGITPGSMPPDSHTHRRRRRADRELPAGRGWPAARERKRARCWRPAPIRRATSTATSPT